MLHRFKAEISLEKKIKKLSCKLWVLDMVVKNSKDKDVNIEKINTVVSDIST